jgi:hypothetical protein
MEEAGVGQAGQNGYANGKGNGLAHGPADGKVMPIHGKKLAAAVAALDAEAAAEPAAAPADAAATAAAADAAASAQRNAFTPERQDQFYELLAESFNVSRAAREVGVSTTTIHRWRRDNAAFAARWQETLEDGQAMAEMQLVRLAVHGELTEVYVEKGDNGESVRRVHRHTVAALLRLMEWHAQRTAAQAQHAQRLSAEAEAAAMSREEKDDILERMRARAADYAAMQQAEAHVQQGDGQRDGERDGARDGA